MRFVAVFIAMLCWSIEGASAMDIDSIKQAAMSANNPIQKIGLYNQLTAYYLNRDIQKADEYHQQTIKLAANKKLSDSLLLELELSKAAIYARFNKSDSAMLLLSNLHALCLTMHQPILAAKTISEKGVVYKRMNNSKAALENFYAALRLYQQHNYKPGIQTQYLNIAVIYYSQKDYNRAITYNKMVANMAKQSHNSLALINAYHNLGLCYHRIGNYQEALGYYNKVLQHNIEKGDSINIAGAYNNIGMIYGDMKEYQLALKYLLKSIHLKELLHDDLGIANSQNNIAKIFLSVNNKVAIQWIDRAIELGVKGGYSAILLESYELAQQHYTIANNYKQAFYFANKYIALKDSITTESVNQQLEQLRIQNESKNIELQLALQNEKIERQNTLQKMYVVLAAVCLLLIIYLMITIIKGRKLNLKLQQQQVKILDQHKELILKKEEAEAALKVKGQFLSVISHEIRTPLNAIVGLVNLLYNNNPRPDQMANLRVLQDSCDNLLTLLNDVLDFSKLEAGKVHINEQLIDLEKLVEAAFKLYEVKAKQKNITYQLEYDSNLPKKVIADGLLLNQVLLNLISNAIKFTAKGFVKVEVELTDTNLLQPQIKFSVSDSGIGIRKEKMQVIFEPFTQADLNTTRQFGGTGLGLAISNKMLELMNTSFELESNINQGSKFSFKLPLKIADKNYTPQQKLMQATPNLSSYRILIAEDNPINVFVIKQFLTSWGAQIDIAENGQEAVDAYRNNKYHLVLMDLHMPIMDGFEATKQILSIDQDAKIIAVTATLSSMVTDEIQSAGMVDVISKPFQPDDLAQRILKVLA